MDDLISRQAAIDAVLSAIPYDDYWKEEVEKAVNNIPPAQPEERTDKHTETHACDLISRQALCEYALNQKDKSVTPNDIMRFPSARSEQIWIPCSEKLPDEDGIYLVTDDSGGVKETHESWFIECDDGTPSWDLANVTAWMPLPEPYKGGEKDG